MSHIPKSPIADVGFPANGLAAEPSPFPRIAVPSRLLRRLEQVTKELWLILSLFALAGLLNVVLASQVVRGLYTLPTVASAYL